MWELEFLCQYLIFSTCGILCYPRDCDIIAVSASRGKYSEISLNKARTCGKLQKYEKEYKNHARTSDRFLNSIPPDIARQVKATAFHLHTDIKKVAFSNIRTGKTLSSYIIKTGYDEKVNRFTYFLCLVA